MPEPENDLREIKQLRQEQEKREGDEEESDKSPTLPLQPTLPQVRTSDIMCHTLNPLRTLALLRVVPEWRLERDADQDSGGRPS